MERRASDGTLSLLRTSLGGRDRALYALQILGVAAAYTVAGRLGLELAYQTSSVTAIWAPTGIALVAILLWGSRLWPGVALGALLTNVDTGVPAVTVLGITCGNTLEALCGAYLLRRVTDFRPSLRRVRDVLWLVVLGAVVSTTVSATIGVASLLVGDAVTWGDCRVDLADVVARGHGRRSDRRSRAADRAHPVAVPAGARPGRRGIDPRPGADRRERSGVLAGHEPRLRSSSPS